MTNLRGKEALRSQPLPNLMTHRTYEKLIVDLQVAEEALRTSGQSVGEAAGDSHEWHDNAAYDQAIREVRINSTYVDMLRNFTKSPVFIEPRAETGDVGIGNVVSVLFDGEEKSEEFTLLGPNDSKIESSWLSYLSPLGSRLIGLKRGQDIEYVIGERKIKAKLIDIQPGNF